MLTVLDFYKNDKFGENSDIGKRKLMACQMTWRKIRKMVCW